MSDRKNWVTGLLGASILTVCVLAIAAVFGGPRGASADVNRDYYNVLRGDVPALYHSAVTATDTFAIGAAPGTASLTVGNPKIAVQTSFSVSGATATLALVLWHKDADGDYTLLGLSDIVTASSSTALPVEDAAGRYLDEDIRLFETAGAPEFELRILSISSGNVTTRLWGYGAVSGRRDP